VRPHIRNIAPAPLPQQQQQQQSRQPKTLVLKTIPLKVKQVAPTTIKMPPRQTSQGLPHNIVHQQPTEVYLCKCRIYFKRKMRIFIKFIYLLFLGLLEVE